MTWSEYFYGYHHILIISLSFRWILEVFASWLARWAKIRTYGSFKPGRIKCDSRKYRRFLFGDSWNDPFILDPRERILSKWQMNASVYVSSSPSSSSHSCCIVPKLECCAACGAESESDCPPAASVDCRWRRVKIFHAGRATANSIGVGDLQGH